MWILTEYLHSMKLGHSYSTEQCAFSLRVFTISENHHSSTTAHPAAPNTPLPVAWLHFDLAISFFLLLLFHILLSSFPQYLIFKTFTPAPETSLFYPLTFDPSHLPWQCGVHPQLQPHCFERLSPLHPQAHWGQGSRRKGHYCSRSVQHTNQHVLTGRHYGRHRRAVTGQGTRQVRTHDQTNPPSNVWYLLCTDIWSHHTDWTRPCV